MSLKDLSPIKSRQPGQSAQTGIFSANNFSDQAESFENMIKQNVNISSHGLLPNIDQFKQKKIIKDQSIPSQILEEINQKREHLNQSKQMQERRRSSLDKVNFTSRYQSSKVFNNMTSQQKISSLQNFNQSPISKNVSNKHQILDLTQNNYSIQNNYNNQQSQLPNNSSHINNCNSPSISNNSFADMYQKRNNSLKINVSNNNDMVNNNEKKGIHSSNFGATNSFLNMSSLMSLQPSMTPNKNQDNAQALSKLESQDILYSKLLNSDKKMTIETDSQKMKNKIILDQKQIQPQKLNFSFHNSNQQSSVPHSNSISSSTNKLFQQHPYPVSNLNQNKLNSLQSPSKDPSLKEASQKDQLNIQLQKRNSSDIYDFKIKEEQLITPLSQKNVHKEFRSAASSPLRASQSDFQQSINKRNTYINQVIKDELKKEILGKSDVKEIIGGVQKNFSFFKTAQNNLKKGGERKDIIQLSQWFDDMTIQLLEKDQFTLHSFLEEFEIVYSGCLTEITRQVSNDCFERGQLIEKLWKIIFFITKEFMKKAQQKYKLTEMENLQEQKRLHTNYQQQIEALKKENINLNKTIEQKDILIRKLYQQKEASKKKSKKYELMHAVLYEDFEFIEKFLVNLNSQNLQMRMKISSFEAQERLYIKDTDPKQRIKDEINKITSNLIDQYSQQLDEQKSNLQELYELKKYTKQKLTVIEKNLDYEFKNGKLQKNGGMDMNTAEYGDDIQLDDDYGQIQMSDQQTDTNDLVIKIEAEVSTKDLYTVESKGTTVYVQTEDIEVQACPTMKEFGTQADIKKILGIEQKGKVKQKESLQELMSEYDELKLPIYQLKNNNYRVQQIIEDEYQNWISKNKDLVNAFKFKDEYSSEDFEYLRVYLEQNANLVKEFIMESLTALINEQQKSIMYKIETFETQLDNQIIKDRTQYQASTLKKIVPKYNELKKEITLLNQNQVQLQLQQLSQQNNQNLNHKRNLSSYQFSKQSSLTYLDPYQDTPSSRSRSSVQQSFQTTYQNKKGNSLKRESTIKFKDEQQSSNKQNSSLSYLKQKSQQNLISNSKEQIPQVQSKNDGNQNFMSNIKTSISKGSDEYRKIENSNTSQNLDESQNNTNQLPEVSKQLKSITSSAISISQQDNDKTDNQQNLQINLSLENNQKSLQSERNTKTIQQIQNNSLNTSNTEEKLLNNEKSQEFISQNNIQLKNLVQDEVLSDQNAQTPIQNDTDKMNDGKNTPNKIYKNTNHLELNHNLFNIQEQSEAYEQTMSPPKHQNQRQDYFQKKKLTILDKQSNLNSDLSSDSDADDKDKPFITKRDQIQDQVYDKKYLNNAQEEDELNQQAENDEFEQALKNLDSNVNNVQPNPNIYSRMRIHASSSKFTELATEFLIKSHKEMKKKKNSNFFFKLTQILKLVFTILQDIKKGNSIVTLSPTNKNSQPTKYHAINHFHIHLFENLMTSYGNIQLK